MTAMMYVSLVILPELYYLLPREWDRRGIDCVITWKYVLLTDSL